MLVVVAQSFHVSLSKPQRLLTTMEMLNRQSLIIALMYIVIFLKPVSEVIFQRALLIIR